MSPDVTQYLPLAKSISRRIHRAALGRRIGTEEDVYQEACVCLIHAVRLYDPANPYGASFLTYAYRSLWSYLKHRAKSYGVIALPTANSERNEPHVERALEVMPLTTPVASHRVRLDDPKAKVKDLLQSREPDPAETIADASVWDALESLREPDRQIVRMLHVEGCTLEAVKAALGLTRVRVREAERRGLADMRRALG